MARAMEEFGADRRNSDECATDEKASITHLDKLQYFGKSRRIR